MEINSFLTRTKYSFFYESWCVDPDFSRVQTAPVNNTSSVPVMFGLEVVVVLVMPESDPPSLCADSLWAAQPSAVWPSTPHLSVGPGRDEDLIRPIFLLLESRWAAWRRAGREPARCPLSQWFIVNQSFLLFFMKVNSNPTPKHRYIAAAVRE